MLRPWFYLAFSLALVPVYAQTPPKARSVPRGSDGHPDLSGIWTNVTITPLERPREMANKEFFDASEVADHEKRTVAARNRDQRPADSERDAANAYNDFWWDSGTKLLKNRRTSIVYEPADGRIPVLTERRKQELAATADRVKTRCAQPGCQPENSGQPGIADNAADRPLMERCISFGTVIPMLPTAYNNNYQIVHTAGTVAINAEMPHEVRRIPTDNSPHLPSNVRQWFGDPRGHWEGDTLVVDTANFDGRFSVRGSDRNLHVVERFTRVDENTILYRFTIDNPSAFTKQWSGEIPLVRAPGPLYEYACHEGNEGMRGILSAARADERRKGK